ncbi:hypothetical protein [Legionella drancourtii]|uniref:Uncharacterized protein n=1 Tax=Legionella drancourtii LLAP12 TaxID=658187 RepID=G9ENC9_9GAMM|nr:hypothetical protein [Legionella drancourtii]EHL31290.1 hypothetical protein LDG_6751 [Legionella drancourtii LLAP12]
MTDFKIGEEVWIISFEVENDFYLLSKQLITELSEEHVECEDEFNTFHVSYDDIYRSKTEALSVMIEKLRNLRDGLA